MYGEAIFLNFIFDFNLNEAATGNCLSEDITQHSKKEVGCVQIWRRTTAVLDSQQKSHNPSIPHEKGAGKDIALFH